ncbi:hypothetical protein HK414_09350 [Ramlibacter terrae]|uniref:Uncharacterized protein n=1 Tax=Ramlibacter terrae TaxID=2732511 RepID=A0ABX6P2V3_9BURK|nr:hypothetical protein HK414_09350 [Ramlibacter terrae]
MPAASDSYKTRAPVLTPGAVPVPRVEARKVFHAQHPHTPATEAHQPPRSDAPADAAAGQQESDAGDGANRGSPAAPVMKQFAKTEAESSRNRK